jgi:hypothetical protein
VAQTKYTRKIILAWPIPGLFSVINSTIKGQKSQGMKNISVLFIFGLDFSVVILYTFNDRKGLARIVSRWQFWRVWFEAV